MRISTRGSYEQGLSMMLQLQAALDHTQRQISSGRRILSPSEDPVAASRALALRESLSRTEQFDRNSTMARNRLGHEETALTTVNDLLQRVRELALQANNATQNDESRSFIATEMRQHLENLVQLANQQDGNGSYLFAGNSVQTKPVARSGAAFSYNGDQGQRLIQIGEGRQIPDGDSGAAVFFQVRSGNGAFSTSAAASNTGTGLLGTGNVVDPTQYDQDDYTVRFVDSANYEVFDSSGGLVSSNAFQSGDTLAFRGIEFSISGAPAAGDEFYVPASRYQDIFSTVQQLANAIEQPANDDVSRATLNNGVNAGLLNIDQAIGSVLDIRTQIGSRLATIDTQTDRNSAFSLTVQSTLAEIEDLDYAEAISRLSLQVTTLEAAQQAFIRTQSLSLFNYF